MSATPKNSGKAPSFQFYWKDWLTDTRLLRASKLAKGVWIDLMALSCDMPKPGVFCDENGPLSDTELAQLLPGNRRENALGLTELILRKIIKQDADGTLYVKRIKRDTEIRDIRTKAGKQGGNPILLNHKSDICLTPEAESCPNQKPPSSSSASSSTSIKKNIKKKTKLCLTKIGFDIESKKFTGITEEQVRIWQDSYSPLNVKRELMNIRDWVGEHWTNTLGKPGAGQKKDYHRCIVNWLKSETRKYDYHAAQANQVEAEVAAKVRQTQQMLDKLNLRKAEIDKENQNEHEKNQKPKTSYSNGTYQAGDESDV